MRKAMRTLLLLSLVSGIVQTQALPNDAPLTGESGFDIIRADGIAPSYPLRYPNVVPKSERVDLDGKPLRRDEDYQIDYERGLVIIFRSVKPGSTLRVTYRHDPKAKTSSGSSVPTGVGSLMGMSMNVAGGSQRLVMGLGLADRRADGSIARSNVYGMKNRFGFSGGGALSGVFFMGDQQSMKMRSALDARETDGEGGKSQAVVQTLGLGLWGGKFEAGTQDISSKFTGWQAFRDSGYSDNDIRAFDQERGLKRFSLGWKDVGPLNLRGDYQKVSEKSDSVESRSYGLTTNGISLDWSSQRVGLGFSRFKDLKNSDRDQLSRERGMNRQNLKVGYSGNGLKGTWSALRIDDGKSGDLMRTGGELALGSWKLGYSDQRVENQFNRFDGTRLADAGQLAQERGMRRQNWVASGAVGGTSLSLSESRFRKDDAMGAGAGALQQSVSVQGKGWGIEQRRLDLDNSMDRTASMAPGEAAGVLDLVGRMYRRDDFAKRGEERGLLNQSAGVDRVGQRVYWGPLSYESIRLNGPKDSADESRLSYSTKSTDLSYRRQGIGRGFNDLNRLMLFERENWGSMSGLDRSDLNGVFRLGKKGEFKLGWTDADRADLGSFARRTVSYQSKDLGLSWNSRDLSSRWTDVQQFNDGERDLLTQLIGFNQSDLSIRWTPGSDRSLRYFATSAKNDTNGESRKLSELGGEWSAWRGSKIGFYKFDRHDATPDELLASQDQWRVRLDQNIGGTGKLCLEREEIRYDGALLDRPDSKLTTIGYSQPINSTTALGTEFTTIAYSNGDQESAKTGRVTTRLNAKTGIELSETMINRKGEGRANEHRRDLGFWWDFGGGMRLNYNFNRRSNTMAGSQQNAGIELTPGQLAGIAVGAASYREIAQDRGNSQVTGNLQLSTVKPLQWGAMRDVTLRYGADTFRDQTRFQRENRSMGAGFRVGKTAIAWDYLSQVGFNGDLAVDRSFRFQTDKDEKNALRASIFYKVRTLPGGQTWIMREYRATWRFARGAELSHEVSSNPEVTRGDVILGSLPQQTRSRKWKLDFDRKGDMKIGLSFNEILNDQARSLSRVGGINLTLFAKNPSPLHLFYGVEQNERNNLRRTMHRYSLRYDQQPGPNQLFSVFLGNTSWQHSRDANDRLQNWSMRLEYQLRF